jgi:hypothetical protein
MLRSAPPHPAFHYADVDFQNTPAQMRMLGYHRKLVEGHSRNPETRTLKAMRQQKPNNMQTHGPWQQQMSIICSDGHERQPSKANNGNDKTENEKKLEKGSDVASSSLLTQLREMSLDSCAALAPQWPAGTPTPSLGVIDPLLCEDQQ